MAGLARVGLAAYGVVHLLVAWLALEVTWGFSVRTADQNGALGTVAAEPWGPLALGVVAVGLVGLACWQLGELRWHYHRVRNLAGRPHSAVIGTVESVGKAVVYLFLAWLALHFALSDAGAAPTGAGSGSASGVLGLPGGRLAVGVVAVVVAGIGVRQWVTGLRRDFLEEVDISSASPGRQRLLTWLGRIGFPAKGTALVVVGSLLGWAAATFDPDVATGLDAAVRLIKIGRAHV